MSGRFGNSFPAQHNVFRIDKMVYGNICQNNIEKSSKFMVNSILLVLHISNWVKTSPRDALEITISFLFDETNGF